MANLQWDVGVNLDTEGAMNQFADLLNEAKAGSEKAKADLNKKLKGSEKTVLDIEIKSNTGEQVIAAKKLYSEWDKIEQQIEKAQKIQEGSLTNLRGQLRQATQVRDQMDKIVESTDKYGNAIESINADWTKQNQLVNDITKKMAKAGSGGKGSLSALQAELKAVTGIRDQINRVEVTTDKYGKTVRRINPLWQSQNKQVNDLNKKIADASGNWAKMITSRIPGGQNIMNLANGITQIGFAAQGAVMALQSINQAIQPLVNRQKQVEGVILAFEGFGLSSEQAAQFMAQAKYQALQYGASLSQLEKGYRRIAPAIMNSGGSMKDVSDAMASLSARATTLGLNTEQSGRYFEAFAQVMGKGKLQGEELNQQFAELDGALRGQIKSYMAAKMGIQDFEGAMQKGQITSQMFLEAFNAISEDMRNNLGGAISEVQSRLDDLNVAQIQEIGKSLDTITMDSLRQTLGPVGKQLQSVILLVQQFFANIATSMPVTQGLFKNLLMILGSIVQAFVVGIIGALKAVFVVLEATLYGWWNLVHGFKALLELIPGVSGFFNSIGGMLKGIGPALAKFTDGWLQLGEGAKVAEQDLSTVDGRVLALKNRFAEGKISVEEFNQGMAELENQQALIRLKGEADELTEAIKELKSQLKDAKEEKSVAKNAFDKEKESLDALKEGVKQYYADKKAQLKATTEATKVAYDRELAAIKRSKEALKARHEQEMNQLKMRNQATQSAMQAEIDALGAATPAEEALAVLRKQEIVDKLKSNDLSEKERLELQAQLERMERQKQIEEAQLKLKAEKENAAKQEAALAKQQKEEQRQLAEEEKAMQESKKKAMQELKEMATALSEEQRKVNEMFISSKKSVDLTGKSLDDIVKLVRDQVSATDAAEAAFNDAAAAVDGINNSLKTTQGELKKTTAEANKTAAALTKTQNKRGSGVGNRPSGQAYGGGSVTGGQSWVVNELGREGFMSLSGRMSEINAPAYGTWTAPSSGTIIPAHLWSQIKAQQAPGAPVSTPGGAGQSSGLMAAVNSLGRAGSNDIVTNNVTIQSDNVDRTMQQSLVSLRRSKRARYY